MKKILKFIIVLTLLFTLTITIFLTIATINNPERDPVTDLSIEKNQEVDFSKNVNFKMTTFNIGYCGLDMYQDFFFDGGSMGRSSSLEKTEENLENISNFLSDTNSDFILLQEVDVNSLRTYRVNQYKYLKESLNSYSASFAENYNAFWVPIPLFEPMGDVTGGMATFSKYNTVKATRYNLEGQESWPMKLFELDRCFIETIYEVDKNKDLYVINIHLSAYDKAGNLRSAQSTHLKRHITELYKQGHYVVMGGDWNQLLSDIQLKDESFLESWPEWLVKVQADFTKEGFKWGVSNIMTVRDLDAPYKEGETFETIIDGFLVSPNVEIIEVIGHDLNFEHSDHNPVSIELKLIE